MLSERRGHCTVLRKVRPTSSMAGFLLSLLPTVLSAVSDWDRVQLEAAGSGKWIRTEPNGTIAADHYTAWLHGCTFEVHTLPNSQWQLRSIKNRKWLSATNGGGSDVTASRDDASGWETWNVKYLNGHQVQLQASLSKLWLGAHATTGVVVKASTPSLTETFNITIVHWIKGVNLGGWLLPEEWISPGSWKGYTNYTAPTCPNSKCGFPPYDAISANMIIQHGKDGALKLMNSYRDNFITKADFEWLAQHGFNTVRVPIGFWDVHPTAPFISGGLAYLDKAFEWASDHEIKVIIDFHGAPGSQTQCDSVSGTCHAVSFTSSANQQLSLDAIEALAVRYSKHWNLMGIELLNEPNSDDAHLSRDALLSYYKKAYALIRKHTMTRVIFMEWNWKLDWWAGKLSEPAYVNVMVDLHQYWCWSTGMSADQIIADAANFYHSLDHYSTLYPAFVGEWSLCAPGVNSKDQKQAFASAQTASYSHGMGYTFWTIHKGPGGTGDTDWSVKEIFAAGIHF